MNEIKFKYPPIYIKHNDGKEYKEPSSLIINGEKESLLNKYNFFWGEGAQCADITLPFDNYRRNVHTGWTTNYIAYITYKEMDIIELLTYEKHDNKLYDIKLFFILDNEEEYLVKHISDARKIIKIINADDINNTSMKNTYDIEVKYEVTKNNYAKK